tara:strand:+ start:455 stop:1228 length:774 start_codon:yes stop_codon:yes gene_type:complete
MSAKYIFRLDDATAYINIEKWRKIEKIFDEFSIFPIVAVVPNNKDSELKYSNYNSSFWNLVRHWEEKGWSIAMHGFEHLYHKTNRNKLIIPYYNKSEFAGLSLSEQSKKISKSIKIFKKNRVLPSLFVAPGHSFDNLTLQALSKETDIKIISDGIALKPYFRNSFYFIPQQIWDVKIKYCGVWTICLHPDTMSLKDIDNLRNKISDNRIYNNTIKVKDLLLKKRGKTIFDYFFTTKYWFVYYLKNILRPILNYFRFE